ncbi:MAG: ATP-dependent DNA helicase [Alphaproteobacteria bacterium]|nr:ATP-dependent DNA helicase [Alphaproteobacteria bacterium]
MKTASQIQASEATSAIQVPDIPILFADGVQTAILSTHGEIQTLPHKEACDLIKDKTVLVCHAPYTAKQLGLKTLPSFDLLELFAFVHPAKFCVPTPTGLAKALGITPPPDFESVPLSMLDSMKALLSDIRNDIWEAKADPTKIANVMGGQGEGWPWTPFILAARGEKYDPRIPVMSKVDLNIWKNLPEWSEEAPPLPPSHHGLNSQETAQQLEKILGPHAEKRTAQIDYSSSLIPAFAPREEQENPHIVLAEAGTGVGKTLGYLAPASVWAEKNQGSVWISTYTKNLQRQVNQELSKIYPHKDVKQAKVAIRKGRENYLCLLNFEEMAAGAALARTPKPAIAAGIMARWIAASSDGDLTSGTDFPGWLAGLLGYQYSTGLSDRRGECIYSACDHYHRCFVERSVRRANHARIVVGNHALTMIKAAHQDEDLPQRIIFDEGHHLFEAADNAFAGHLTARETFELRRWIRGSEQARKSSRVRGLKSRAQDLIAGDEEAETDLNNILNAARNLTAHGWTKRLKDGAPKGPAEEFISQIYTQIMARNGNANSPYTIETESFPLNQELLPAITKLRTALEDIKKPMMALIRKLQKKLEEQSDTLTGDTRKRIDALRSGLERRIYTSLSPWISMLETLENGQAQNGAAQQQQEQQKFIDWMAIEKIDGRTFDIGLYRHWVDPMVPFSQSLSPHAHGIAITSATLRDIQNDDENSWHSAKIRTGADYFSSDIITKSYPSPYNYREQTKIFIVNDVPKNDLDQMAACYEALFKASNGGSIGLFTAISRLKYVHEKIKPALLNVHIPLYAQHADEMDIGTLIDIFREEENSCLLGTDAVRDGVDIPGNSLRLMIFDRVPWPRPTILHKARRNQFGGRAYDDQITRLKLKQAYGRLIRQENDKGVFVMLDNMMPSRLFNAFPKSVTIEKLPSKEVIEQTKEFLK